MQKKTFGEGGSGRGGGGQGGCEPRIEAIVRMQRKKIGGLVGGWQGGARGSGVGNLGFGDVNQELKLL